MKRLLTAAMLTLSVSLASAQTVTQNDFNNINALVSKESWKEAFKASSLVLENSVNDSSDLHAQIIYFNLISAAGMVTQTQMNYKDLEKNVLKYEGQRVIMAARPVTDRDGALGLTKFSAGEKSYEAFTSVTNAKKLNILSFEKFIIKDKINISEYQDTTVNCGGILEKIETNPSQSINWVLRLTVRDAFVKKTT